jgi:CubicO group peptidase (beta-lactamase class C family)
LIHDEIGQVLKRFILATGAAPGASAALAAFRNGRWLSASGVAGVLTSAEPSAVRHDTIYDLASLTKPMVAALAARWLEREKASFAAPLTALLPAARGTASEAASLALLASHRAGLVAHLRLGDGREGPPADVVPWLVRCANARREECGGPLPPDGYPPVYSDLGYILLGRALSEASGEPLEQLLEREVCTPLGIGVGCARDLGRRLGASFLERVAPTEVVEARGGELRGVVHDDNCWELVGKGLAGHAGLFGTAADVLGFGTAMLDALAGRSDWLAPDSARALVAPRPGGSLRMGFDGKAETGSSAGPRFGADAFGHLGFTGTSVWCDPDADIVVVLLTNRVWPSRENIVIRSVRPSVHGELFGLAADLRTGG